MPDQQIDRVIRSIEQNNGVLSNVLAKEVPLFHQHPAVWAQVVASVRQALRLHARTSRVMRKYPLELLGVWKG